MDTPTGVATISGALNGALFCCIFKGIHPSTLFIGLLCGGIFGSTIGNVIDSRDKPGGIIGDFIKKSYILIN